MKTHIIHIMLVTAMIALGWIGSAAAQDEDSVIATVIRINGGLEYRENNNGDWDAASVGLGLMNGWGLRTGSDDRAIIVYGSGTRVLINENTELEIVATSAGGAYTRPSMERAKLFMGEIYSRITPGTGTGYEVETPSSIASVRGTEFNSLFRNGLATFVSLENVVAVTNQFGSVNIDQFQMTQVPEGGSPEEPTTLSPDEARGRAAWLDDVDPEWRLNMVPQGGDRHETGAPFLMSIWAQNRETGAIDTGATFTLTRLESRLETVEFSTDNQRTWSRTPQVEIVNGQANVYIRGDGEGTATILCRAPGCEGGQATVNFVGANATKQVELRFADPDGGGEETIVLEMEER